MATRVRHFTLVSISVLIVAVTVTWQLATDLNRNHLEFLRSGVTAHLAALRTAVQASDRQIFEGLISAYEAEASARHTSGRTDRSLALTKKLEDSKALMLSQRQLVSGTWVVSWTSTSKEAAGWPANFVKELLPSLPLGRVQPGNLDWTRIELPGGRVGWATVTAVDIKVGERSDSVLILSVLPLPLLAELGDTSGGEAFIIDDKGYALSWTDPKYLGARLDNDELVQRSIKGSVFKGDGAATSLDGRKVWGGYEKVPGSNLTVGYSVPMAMNWGLMADLAAQTWMVVVGLILVLGFGFVWLTQRYINGYEFMRRSILNLASGAPIAQPQEVFREVVDIKGVLDAIEAKNSNASSQGIHISTSGSPGEDEAYRHVIEGVGRALRGPLATVLGHAQLARAKSEHEDELKTHYTVIEREARTAREVVENLAKMIQAERPTPKKSDLSDIILSGLALAKEKIQEGGLTVKKDLTPQTIVMVDIEHTKRAIESLILALCKAAENEHLKGGELRVSSRKDADHIKLEMKVANLKASTSDLSQIFQPFSSIQSSLAGDGVSLTTALGLIEGQKGRLYCDQNPEGGLSFVVELVSGSREMSSSVADERPAVQETLSNEDIEEQGTSKKVQVDAWVEQEARKIDLAVVAARASVNDLKQTMVIDGEPSAAEVAPSPSAKAYPQIPISELGGKRPLTGSKVGGLPTAPALDELTLSGVEGAASVAAVPETSAVDLAEIAPALPIRIRKPIVRIKN